MIYWEGVCLISRVCVGLGGYVLDWEGVCLIGRVCA